jgi:hypothetical protein
MHFIERNSSQQSLSAYHRDLERLWRQARDGGVGFELLILRNEEMAEVLRTRPDNDSLRAFFLTMKSWFSHVGEGARPMCLCCQHRFLPDNVVASIGAFVLLRPVAVEASCAGIGICRSCCDSRTDAELLSAAKAFAVSAGLADAGTVPMKIGNA